ncbi:Uncharacterised protein [Mycobacterium tuberculosis]|uniref:Uncharacterized protein n=1 Tax=Mycobacterium tuberculosis TaxID=1773 RepID=A0A0U0T9R4_MYCTX|nr:Uncharacterised protein [Mycobacterium tuberculosis]COX37403.1 Uncharacterised protein [Mycobacterium tuberculosis]CPA15450.1 Uncharacterised protein [Mycobacterium tuberculosis]
MPPLPYSSPPAPPFGLVAVPGAPSPISGRPNNVSVGALTAPSRSCCAVCNCDAMVASAAAYDPDAEFSVCTNC